MEPIGEFERLGQKWGGSTRTQTMHIFKSRFEGSWWSPIPEHRHYSNRDDRIQHMQDHVWAFVIELENDEIEKPQK